MASIFKQAIGSGATGDIDKLITGDVVSPLIVGTDKTLTIDLESCSYRTFNSTITNNIETINISNAIMGSQAVVFLNINGAVNINGLNGSGVNVMSGTGIKTGYDTTTLASGDYIVMTICSDGTNHYINLNKFA